jgi:hypothetical protein
MGASTESEFGDDGRANRRQTEACRQVLNLQAGFDIVN